jgi:hypothetical protein
MSDTPQITTHYADGTPSETRDMTPEEIAELLPEGSLLDTPNETPTADA